MRLSIGGQRQVKGFGVINMRYRPLVIGKDKIGVRINLFIGVKLIGIVMQPKSQLGTAFDAIVFKAGVIAAGRHTGTENNN